MADDHKLRVSSWVVAREVGGETMLMDLESGTYFGLDPIGRRVWQALEDGLGSEQLLDQLQAEFEVTPEQLRIDVEALHQKLLDHKLVAEVEA